MDIIKIRDLNSAALLQIKGFKLVGIEWEQNIAFWCFEDYDNRSERLIREFLNSKVLGNIKRFAEAQKTLRQMLFNKY